MANRAIEPVLLPWKRPKKGVSVAVLGARFRVEQQEDGWHCTVKVGRQVEVLATGLPRLRDAQFKAEAHAATLPAVAAALDKQAARTKKAVPATEAHADEPATTPSVETPLPYGLVEDGCIYGKIAGGTWVAGPSGTVSVPSGTDPAIAQQICRVAAYHYNTLSAEQSAAGREKSTAKASTKVASKRGRNAPAPPTPPDAASASTAQRSKHVKWEAVDGAIRGAAKHGTFVVEPEGKRYALYFYDEDGQSRHIESGELAKLRSVAEEMAARGLPAARSPVSSFDDAALVRAFLGDDA